MEYEPLGVAGGMAGHVVRTYHCPTPLPVRDYDWSAIPEDLYDGAEDSRTRHLIGWGATREAAIADLRKKLKERDDRPVRVAGGVR